MLQGRSEGVRMTQAEQPQFHSTTVLWIEAVARATYVA
jgi:hypothetical protein